MLSAMVKVRRLVIGILVGALALSACTRDVQDIEAAPAEKGGMDVPLPYQVVYDDLKEAVFNCFPTGGTVSSHRYPASMQLVPGKYGRVAGYSGGALGEQIRVLIEVKAVTDTTTHLDYYSDYFFADNLKIGGASKFRPVLENWVAGKSYECGR